MNYREVVDVFIRMANSDRKALMSLTPKTVVLVPCPKLDPCVKKFFCQKLWTKDSREFQRPDPAGRQGDRAPMTYLRAIHVEFKQKYGYGP